jgi:hypothetical protein
MALNYEAFFVIKRFFCEVTHAYCSFKIRPVPVGHPVYNHERIILVKSCMKFRAVITNSVASVRERTIPTEQPLPVGEIKPNFCE